MHLYRQHKLHSGPGGPIVKTKKQATAIQISMARKEGHHIPEVKGSFQQGGLVPETGNYQVHQGERVRPPTYGRQPVRLEDTGMAAQKPLPELVIKSAPTTHHNFPEHEPIMRHGGAPVPPVRREADAPAPSAQAQDIASRTRAAEDTEWRAAMRKPGSPLDLVRDAPPAKTSAHYAVEGLKGNVAQRMHEQGERAVRGNFDEGGTVTQTGDYKAQKGEELVPPDIGTSRPGGTGPGELPPALGAPSGIPPPPKQNAEQKKQAQRRPNPELEAMQANVAAPLMHSNIDSFKRGGTIPRTGIYRLHAGEHVIPKSLASRYRQMKER